MAATRLFSLDLGMQTVSLAEFRPASDGSLCLASWKKIELIADPGADATRAAQLESACRELRTALKIPNKTLTAVTLPSQSVFSRFVKLPGATHDDIAQIIGFEAQQNVPFPIDEVVWDYQVIGEAREGSWDVALVAIKGDHLSEVVHGVVAAGLTPDCINSSTGALFNAYRYNYPDVDEAVVLVDIGARTTNVIFVEGEHFFSRTIPVGGITLSAAIAKEFQQDITLAEMLKIEKGFVSLGGAYAEPEDPTVAKISKILRNSMMRLHSEIVRSISFYRQNQGGAAPVRVLLTGGGSQLPYAVEFFAEKLQLPVEFFNPLRRVSVQQESLAHEVTPHAHLLGELVGGALQMQGNGSVNINLRPPELVKEKDLARRKPFLAAAVALLLLALGAWCGYFHYAIGVAEERFAEVESKLKGQADNDALTGIEALAKDMDAVRDSEKKAEEDVAPFLQSCNDRSAWPAILDALATSLPSKFIWVTDLAPVFDSQFISSPASSDARPSAGRGGRSEGGRGSRGGGRGAPAADRDASGPTNAIAIKGLYLSNPPNEKQQAIIDEFVDNLKKSPVFNFNNADGTPYDMKDIIQERETPDNEHWAYGFTLLLPLTNPMLQ